MNINSMSIKTSEAQGVTPQYKANHAFTFNIKTKDLNSLKSMEEGDGLRTRSFRNEDYNTRRAFLRSYPLNFDNDEQDQEPQVHVTTTRSNKVGASELGHGEHDKKERTSMKMKKKKEAMKRIMVTIIEWGGGRVVVLRRFKHKVSFYVVACFPIVFKSSKALTSKP